MSDTNATDLFHEWWAAYTTSTHLLNLTKGMVAHDAFVAARNAALEEASKVCSDFDDRMCYDCACGSHLAEEISNLIDKEER